MTVKALALLTLTLAAFAISSWRFWRRLKPLASARAQDRTDRMAERLSGLIPEVGGHRRLLKNRLSGVLHLMIFVSFLVLLSVIVKTFGETLIPGFSLDPIGGETVIALMQDIFAVVMLTGVGLAAYNRFVIRPERFQGSNNRDATIILVLITLIVVAMELEFAFEILGQDGGSTPWRPVAGLLAGGVSITGVDPHLGVSIFFWVHAAAILAFLIYIPGSKHLHMFVGVPNIIFRNLKPKGVLPSPALPVESAGEALRGMTVQDLSWKGMLDLYSCTECGRCQEACPAHNAGLPLSPKRLIMDMRDHLVDVENGVAQASTPLAGGVISQEVLGACTTCRACMDVCPLHIEHVPKIIDMRRDLVDRGEVEPLLQESLESLQKYGNSFKKPARQRAKWTKRLDFKIPDARETPVDLLWFVGDFASYDPRAQRISQMIATVLHKGGVDFGLLYDGEQNSGNDVRRAGDEGLFEMLAEHNIDQLSNAEFGRIMTADPHSLNALGQEYKALGASYDVVHYTQILDELLTSGALSLADGQAKGTATYHDPCYLGRYNDAYDAPRRVIEKLGYKLHDMPRCRENSFCCGAGGGRIWMDDSASTERPSENRIREALALGNVDVFVVTCPKDLVMYTAAVDALGVSDQIVVKDLCELVYDAMGLTDTRDIKETLSAD
jgi:Fe-S oxidoreductase